MKSVTTKLLALVTMAYLMVPEILWAAGGGGDAPIVVVADTRVVHGIMRYFSNLYNTDILLFAVWAVVLTAAYGCFLGVLMDKLMSLTGLDLKSRKIVEH